MLAGDVYDGEKLQAKDSGDGRMRMFNKAVRKVLAEGGRALTRLV